MSSANFASFAPYRPPPDDPEYLPPATSKISRPWFPNHQSSQGAEISYQSGGIPTFNDSASGGVRDVEEIENQNQWETRYGMKVDLLAAFAYIFGPISALIILITETQNDYVRFHGYQSALLTTPLVIFRLFLSLMQFPQWLRTFFTLTIIGLQFYMAIRAYIDASYHGLSRFQLPVIGPLASRWLTEE